MLTVPCAPHFVSRTKSGRALSSSSSSRSKKPASLPEPVRLHWIDLCGEPETALPKMTYSGQMAKAPNLSSVPRRLMAEENQSHKLEPVSTGACTHTNERAHTRTHK